ncbi:hypothetical protein GQ600_9033 [Phytophthora cactorum]|nr:hypothetical protein GQ600_9033 [Phytophthora cactorum]
MEPERLEAVMSLSINRELWDVYAVEIIRHRLEPSKRQLNGGTQAARSARSCCRASITVMSDGEPIHRDIDDPEEVKIRIKVRQFNRFSNTSIVRLQALVDFSCGRALQFDKLYPLFVTPEGRLFDEHGSSGDVDIFVAALPVKEVHDLYVDVINGKEEFMHNYLWMIRWLDSSMGLSEISHLSIRTRLNVLKDYLLEDRKYVDEHLRRYHTMCSDDSVALETLHYHEQEGRLYEIIYKRREVLVTVIGIVGKLADAIQHESIWKSCPCSKCDVYCSPEWLKTQSADTSYEPFVFKIQPRGLLR